MGRKKTISDDEVLAVARGIFGRRGHTASTREIARAAGVSEAVLYQRFETKEKLFLAAMAPQPLDIRQIFGPVEPSGDPRIWVHRVVERMSGYFAEILPLAIQVMLHPSFDVSRGGPTEAASTTDRFEAELATRLRGLEGNRKIAAGAEGAAARLLVSLAHDWALRSFLRCCDVNSDRRRLAAMVGIAWKGLAPESREKASAAGRERRQARKATPR